MFASSGQASVFISCVAFGFAGGIIFSLVQPFKTIMKNNMLNFFADFSVLFVLSFIFCEFCIYFSFPSLRGYMIFGVFVGIFIYFKSFYITIAKINKKMYNIFKNIAKSVVRKIKNFTTRNLRKGHLKR